MTDSFNSGKLHIPVPPSALVERFSLMDQLNQSFRSRLTLISAPAGYGKSSLVSEWIDNKRLPITWLTLDELDNDLTLFVNYFIGAHKRFRANFGDQILSLLDNPQSLSEQNLHSMLLTEISTFKEPYVLVLDDYHNINNEAIHKIITLFIENTSLPIHLILLTRSDPPMPLSRLRARGQLVEIRAADLQFTPAEAESFFNNALKMGLSVKDIAALEERAEGWVTGLQLTALAMKGFDPQQTTDFVNEFTGSHSYIVDYLVEEILNRQPELIRNFLLRSSILDRMTAALCNQVVGIDDSQAVLEKLDQENLFIIPLDNERHWFRYHHLFSDVLENQLKKFSPDLIPSLHRLASEWYEENGFISEAISHALANTNNEKAAALIEQNAKPLLVHGEFRTLLRWINELNSSAYSHPWICVYAAWAYVLSGKTDYMEVWLMRAKENLTEEDLIKGHDTFIGSEAAIRAYAAATRGDAQAAMSFAQKALDNLPETNLVIRSVVTFTLGTAYRLNGNSAEASRFLERAAQLGHQAGNLYLEIGAMASLADICYGQGKLHQAYDLYEELLRVVTRPDGQQLHTAGMAYDGLALICYEWGRFDSAEKYVEAAIACCKKWGNVTELAESYIIHCRLLLAEGKIEEAQHALNSAENLSHSYSLVPRVDSWMKAYRVRLWLAKENLEAASKWAESYQSLDLADKFSYVHEAEYAAFIRVQIAQKRYKEALDGISKLLEGAEAVWRTASLIELQVLRAIAYQGMGDTPNALEALRKGLVLARPEEYTRVFLDEGPAINELLRYAGSRGIESKYAAMILEGVNQETASTAKEAQPLIDPLSERELEILNLLAKGCTNQEIAEQLIIAVGTVKAHTVNIFRKLNVNRRMQAVTRARELNLL
jgi:LuxR family maltose regulon positive regulatory protein